MRVLRGFLGFHPLKLGVAFAAGSIGVWEPGCGKELVRSLGRGNEQDARFTMLRDSETPRRKATGGRMRDVHYRNGRGPQGILTLAWVIPLN